MSAASAGAGVAAIVSQLGQVVWRANQMGSAHAGVMSSGHPMLDAALPQGGWPGSVLIELLLRQPGIGEMRLLRPALAGMARQRRIALVQPPHKPHAAAWSGWGMPAQQLVWIKTAGSADALWAAEQVLRNGSCGALIVWQRQIRMEALRRLHLAAQASDAVFWIVRPLAAAHEPSPAPLRLALRPARAGLAIDVVKRRGPTCGHRIYLPFDDAIAAPLTLSGISHARVDQCAPALAASRSTAAVLA